MKFLEKLRAEAHNAFHEEKKKINAEIERKRAFETMLAKHDETISMRLRQIGDTFCRNFFFLNKLPRPKGRGIVQMILKMRRKRRGIRPAASQEIQGTLQKRRAGMDSSKSCTKIGCLSDGNNLDQGGSL